MKLATLPNTALAPTPPHVMRQVLAMEKLIAAAPQKVIHTQHVLHAGLYTRTIMIPEDTLLSGALVKIPTVLVVCGDCLVSRGENTMHIEGVAVLPASAGRKQIFATYKDTTVTMVFATDVTTIEEAEAQFTDDTDLLMSRRDPSTNTIIITGE